MPASTKAPPILFESLNLQGYDRRHPIRVFVIEQSGTDSVRELGTARLSLYERVYNHQLTRNAQGAFEELIHRSARSPDVKDFADFLFLWSLPEDVVLNRLAAARDPTLAAAAADLASRRLPKRAACFGREYLVTPKSPVEAVRNTLQDSHELRLQDFSGKLLSHLDGPEGVELLTAVRNECRRVRDILLQHPPASRIVPNEQEPSVCRFLPYPRAHDSIPPAALVIRNDKIERFGERHSSYMYAGEAPSQIGYLVVPDPWREIALFAFQRIFYRGYHEDYEIDLEQAAQSDIRNRVTLSAIFRPAIEFEVGREKLQNQIG